MYKLLLCLRYLRTRYIALASIISVMLGVATMIVVNSVMAGFSGEMRDRIKGVMADVIVESRSSEGIEDPDAQMALIREVAGEHIAAMTPIVEFVAMISFTDPSTEKTFTQKIQLVGIDPESKASVGPLRSYLDSCNPVVKDGVVVREALRSADEPLGWELTEQARERRRLRKLEDLNYLQRTQPVDPLGQPVASAANETTETEAPVFDGPADTQEDEAPEFIEGPQFVENQPVVPADPAAPFPARIYLGEQITGFLVTDPQTGESSRMNLIEPGDDVIITTVTATTPPKPLSFSATVVDMFRSGMAEYDSNLVLMNLEQLQEYRGMLDGGEAVTSIQIRLKDYSNAPEVVTRLRAAFPPNQVSVDTWEARQGLLLQAVDMETAILNVLLFLIIAVAGFGILAIFFMIVVEKTRDIGILKSLGASSRGVMSIFLSYGVALGVVGSIAGVAIGLLFVAYINQIEDVLSAISGRTVFDEKIYYFKEIPTYVSPAMVFWVATGAIGIAVLASVLPARRASRLHPVRALRFE